MNSKTACSLLVAILLLGAAPVGAGTRVPASPKDLKLVERWFILLDYDRSRDHLSPAQRAGFDMAILDPDAHPDLGGFPDRMVRIAYLSLGEAAVYRPYWEKIKDKPWVLSPNPDWEGARTIDIRSAEWKEVILGQEIPRILAEGFDGLMLDTLDTAAMLEEKDAEKYRGAKEAMADLVKSIRRRYPGLLLISNNGFAILREIAPELDALLAEDLHGTIDFQSGGYAAVPEEDRQPKVTLLKEIMETRQIAVFNIDYVAENDLLRAEEYLRKSRNLGFKPYVAEKDLDKVYPANL